MQGRSAPEPAPLAVCRRAVLALPLAAGVAMPVLPRKRQRSGTRDEGRFIATSVPPGVGVTLVNPP